MVESRKLKFEWDEAGPSVHRRPPAVQRQLAEEQVQSGKGGLAGVNSAPQEASPGAGGGGQPRKCPLRTSGGDPLDPRKAVEAFIEAQRSFSGRGHPAGFAGIRALR
jgi:hypothetical protein